jgi:hypothetical protein
LLHFVLMFRFSILYRFDICCEAEVRIEVESVRLDILFPTSVFG